LVQFDLFGWPLDDDLDSESVFTELSRHTSLKSLELGSASSHHRQCFRFPGQTFSGMKDLTFLTLRECLQKDACLALKEPLLASPNLLALNLSNNEGGNELAFMLADVLKVCSRLQDLSLMNNCITDEGACQLAISCPSTLSVLDLSHNLLTSAGANRMVEILHQTMQFERRSCACTTCAEGTMTTSGRDHYLFLEDNHFIDAATASTLEQQFPWVYLGAFNPPVYNPVTDTEWRWFAARRTENEEREHAEQDEEEEDNG